jgi:hypothetical protein
MLAHIAFPLAQGETDSCANYASATRSSITPVPHHHHPRRKRSTCSARPRPLLRHVHPRQRMCSGELPWPGFLSPACRFREWIPAPLSRVFLHAVENAYPTVVQSLHVSTRWSRAPLCSVVESPHILARSPQPRSLPVAASPCVLQHSFNSGEQLRGTNAPRPSRHSSFERLVLAILLTTGADLPERVAGA